MTKQEISDLHFEVYGVRPSPGFWAWWDLCTEDGKQEVLDSMVQRRDHLDEQAYSQR